jgi:uncharacterized protein (DUF934 family)
LLRGGQRRCAADNLQIIRDRSIVDDDFVHVADGAELPATGKPIVTLARFVKEREALLARTSALGVRVPSDKLPSDIPDLEKLALVAIEFAKFTEGRGYSVGRMLRQCRRQARRGPRAPSVPASRRRRSWSRSRGTRGSG